MIKKGMAVLLAICFLMSGIAVFAQEPQPIITEAYFYTGTLYYCDPVESKVVLKNVNAMGNINEKNTRTAAEAEYAELPISGTVTLKDGRVISYEECNYYPDSEVRVLITRSDDDTLRVIQMRFR